MSSSNESEDESMISKKKASNSYLTLLNSNNKFSEMLKNKIKQTDGSPNLSKSFEPIASSTQIGTPTEIKRKKHVNHGSRDYRDVIVKKEQISEDSGSERNVSKKQKRKITKKKVSRVESESSDEATARDEEIIATKSTEHVSESSVDSESDSDDSSDTQRNAAMSKIVKKMGVMSKEPFSKKSNFKINFARYNTNESASSKHKKSEIDNLPSPSYIKREVSSDMGSPDRRTTVSKKKKPKLTRKTSTSESSDNDRTHLTVPPSNGNTSKQKSSDDSDLSSDKVEKRPKKKKKQKKGKPTNDPKTSTSGSEDEVSQSKLQPTESLVTKGKRRNNDESSTSSEDERQQSKQDKNDDRSNKTPSSRLRKLEQDDTLTAIPNHFDSFDNIKAKDDVYIIQIPIKLDPNRLIGTTISLTDHIRVNKKYDSIVSYEPQEPITICNNTELLNVKILRPVGSIKLQRRLQSTEIPDVPDVLNKSVAFPTNLKSRHPLFGSNFDNKITLEERVKMKLESVRDSSPVKKKKKKKEKRHRVEETEHQEEEIFKFLSRGNEGSEHAEKKKKKKKKRENSECEERHEKSSKKRRSEEVEEEVPKKKKKKHKEGIEDFLIEEMLSSMKKKKKKKKKES